MSTSTPLRRSSRSPTRQPSRGQRLQGYSRGSFRRSSIMSRASIFSISEQRPFERTIDRDDGDLVVDDHSRQQQERRRFTPPPPDDRSEMSMSPPRTSVKRRSSQGNASLVMPNQRSLHALPPPPPPKYQAHTNTQTHGSAAAAAAAATIASYNNYNTNSNKLADVLADSIRALDDNIRHYPVVLIIEHFSDYAGRCRSIQKILSNLGVPDHDVLVYSLDSSSDGALTARHITRRTGYDSVPVLFIGGSCVGDYSAILGMQRSDYLRPRLLAAGVKSVVNAIPAATLEENIFGYPKALVEGQQAAARRISNRSDGGEGKARGSHTMNVLVACCGSSAADKIPTLVEQCVANGWSVKLLTTKSGEHFFKSFGSDRVVAAIGSENIYRDEDEWSFEYENFDMPVRACHLALRKWADVLVVAPITCNSMAKCVAGIGDNLLSSVLVAWEYHRKTAIFCPACNADMWNNLPTQRNVAFIRKMGVEILGPRVDRLTNGQVAIGCMEYVEKIVDRLEMEETNLLVGTEWVFRRAQVAAATDDPDLWNLVLRAVDEGIVDVNVKFEDNGTTLLHLAAGGESYVDAGGKLEWGNPDIEPMRRLIAMGADVNASNKYGFTPIRVALATRHADAVKVLVDANADTTATLVDFQNLPKDIVTILSANESSRMLMTKYYFTYGSLKRGFPNYEGQAKHLQKFVATATTVERLPLVVPHEPSCTNPHCPFLHQQATLCNMPGTGKNVVGEIFEVEATDLEAFDKLEGFVGSDVFTNVYNRSIIDVQTEELGIVQAYVYFSANTDETMYLVESGRAAFIDEYQLSMAKGDLKPGFSFVKGLIEKPAEMTEETIHIAEKDFSEKQAALQRDVSTLIQSTSTESSRRPRVDKLVREQVGSIQQAINTCNLAAITMALKILGINVSIDAMFSSLKLPTCWVVEDGLTLSQVFNVIIKLTASSNAAEALAPGINAECFHFDDAYADYDAFLQFLELTLGDDDDVAIANFSTKVARNAPSGGGHFSLIASYDPEADLVTIADVHPMKYGAEWTCSSRDLFDSMVDKDSGVSRSRGIIRLATKYATSITCLNNCRMAVSFRDPMFNEEEQHWLSNWGDLPINSFESHLNMGGLNCIGLCISGFLTEDDYLDFCLPNHVGGDYLAWALGLSVTELLGGVQTPRALTNHIRRAFDKMEVDLLANCIMADTRSADALYQWLISRVGPPKSTVALALLDINETCGFPLIPAHSECESARLNHGSQHWCVVTMVKDANTVVIADTRAKLMSRLWTCSVSQLRKGLLGSIREPGRLILVSSTS